MGWSSSIPVWLQQKILEDREKNTEKLAPISDVTAALMVASLNAPLSRLHGDLYAYCFTRLLDAVGLEVSSELRRDSLSEYENRELNSIRRTLYRRTSRRS